MILFVRQQWAIGYHIWLAQNGQGAGIQNLAKAKVYAFKDNFVQMNFDGALISCLEIQVLNVILIC